VSKPYSILAAALVANGRSLSTESIGAPRAADRMSRFFIGDDWPFCDGNAILADATEPNLVSGPAPHRRQWASGAAYSPTL